MLGLPFNHSLITSGNRPAKPRKRERTFDADTNDKSYDKIVLRVTHTMLQHQHHDQVAL